MGKDTPRVTRLDLRDAGIVLLLSAAAWAVLGAWLGSLTGLAPWFFVVWWVAGGVGGLVVARSVYRKCRAIAWPEPRCWGWDEWVLSAVLGVVVLAALVMALGFPPNNADSLIYHLPRQIFWMAHGGVFGAEFSNSHMVKMPPGSEYFGLNLYVLLGTDRWHNLVQWVALVGCLAAISRLVDFAGGGRRGQLAGAIVFAVTPAVFFEASNTKNDLLVAFFLLGVAWCLVLAVRVGRLGPGMAAIAGGFTGCALLTKGTAIAFLPVLALAFLCVVIARRIRIEPLAVVIGLTVVAVFAAPHYAPQGAQIAASEQGASASHANAVVRPLAGISVAVQNLALQLATPRADWNESLEQIVNPIASTLGYPTNDPRITFFGSSFAVAYHPEHEDRATGLPQWLLLIVAAVAGWALVPGRQRGWVLCFALTAVGMFLVFSLLFRWQPWHGRLLIPCVAMGAVGGGLICGARGRGMTLAVVAVCVAWLVPSLDNSHRPLLGPRSLVASRDDDTRRNVDVLSDVESAVAAREVFSRVNPRRVMLDFEGDGLVHSVLREVRGSDGQSPELVIGGDARDVDLVLVKREDAEPPNLPDGHAVPLGERWTVVVPRDRAEAVAGLGRLPAFAWPGDTAGLGPLQGPYPEHGLPRFRNAYFPKVVLEGAGAPVAREVVIGLATYAGGNRVTIRVADELIETDVPDDGSEVEVRVMIPPGDDVFTMVLEFEKGYESQFDPHPVAVRFYRIQVYPVTP